MIAPLALIDKSLPTLEAANSVATLFVNEILFTPLLLSAIAPLKLLLPFKVIAPAPALSVVVPALVIAPV